MNKRFFLLFAGVLCLAIAAYASVPIGTLAGSVLDAHGEPVANAAVTIQTSDATMPYGAHTDAEGHFQIKRIETGQYDLRASHEGLISEWTKRVMVHANKTTTVVLRLPARKP
jgi:hypothetical protein